MAREKESGLSLLRGNIELPRDPAALRNHNCNQNAWVLPPNLVFVESE